MAVRKKSTYTTLNLASSKYARENVNTKRMTKQMIKNGEEMSRLTMKYAKKKYVPRSTDATWRSVKLRQTRSKTFELSSLNYENVGKTGITRYNWTKGNKPYYAYPKNKPRIYIPTDKNKNRYKWFIRSHQDNRQDLKRISSKGLVLR